MCSSIWTRINQFLSLFSRALPASPSKLLCQFQFFTVCFHLLVSIIFVSISLLFRVHVLITTETCRCAIITFQIKVNTNIYTHAYVHTQMCICTWNSIKTFYAIHTHLEPNCSINNFSHAHMHVYTYTYSRVCSCVSNPSSVVDCDAGSEVATKSIIIQQQDAKITATGNQ